MLVQRLQKRIEDDLSFQWNLALPGGGTAYLGRAKTESRTPVPKEQQPREPELTIKLGKREEGRVFSSGVQKFCTNCGLNLPDFNNCTGHNNCTGCGALVTSRFGQPPAFFAASGFGQPRGFSAASADVTEEMTRSRAPSLRAAAQSYSAPPPPPRAFGAVKEEACKLQLTCALPEQVLLFSDGLRMSACTLQMGWSMNDFGRLLQKALTALQVARAQAQGQRHGQASGGGGCYETLGQV